MTKTMKFAFSKAPKQKSDTVVALIGEDKALHGAVAVLDRDSGGLIAHVLKTQTKFTGKRGQILAIPAPKNKGGVARYILAGTGGMDGMTGSDADVTGGRIYAALGAAGAVDAAILIPEAGRGKGAKGKTRKSENSGLSMAEFAARLASGMRMKSYTFDRYKSKADGAAKTKKGAAKPTASPRQITLVLDDAARAATLDKMLHAATDGVALARDLANEPPNVLYPDSFAKMIVTQLKPLGVEVSVFDDKKMKQLGMGAHLAVGQGSARPPRVVIMRWNGLKTSAKSGKKAPAPLALVGKGVTFDTGGISIKPAAGMDDMKMDMGGAAAVVGAMRALAARKAKVNVVAIVGLAENMPSDRAYRPGDIVTSLSGKTIEVLNTDAEGRLVLCDAMTYVQKTYKPHTVIDLATLTGAIMVALGSEYAGAYANCDDLWSKLSDAAQKTGDKLWRMPLDAAYRDAMVSTIADLRNISGSPHGGSCTAAGFLQHFVTGDTAWAHLDIAGTAWVGGDKPLGPKGGTGFGVRLLDRLIADHYE